jgi:branched-subunit amino acid transport protein AzlD
MTTVPTTPDTRLSMRRLAVAASATMGVLFVLCWLGAQLGLPVTHGWVKLFTFAPVDSLHALTQGLGWSIVIGGVVGAVAAFFYNSFAVFQQPDA